MHTGKSISQTPKAIKPEHLCNPHPDREVNIDGSQNPLQTSGSQLPCSDLRLNHKVCRCHTLLISLVSSRAPRIDSEYALLAGSFRTLFAVDPRCPGLCALDILSRSTILSILSIPSVFFFMSFAFLSLKYSFPGLGVGRMPAWHTHTQSPGFYSQHHINQALGHTPVVPAPERERQMGRFDIILSYKLSS